VTGDVQAIGELDGAKWRCWQSGANWSLACKFPANREFTGKNVGFDNFRSDGRHFDTLKQCLARRFPVQSNREEKCRNREQIVIEEGNG
jgi:hypothetical protein